MMKKFTVDVPITGFAVIEVEAKNEQGAIIEARSRSVSEYVIQDWKPDFTNKQEIVVDDD